MTKPTPAQLERVIADCLRAIQEQNGATAPAQVDVATALFGPGAPLDSMGLVTLVVDVEQRLQQDFGIAITLADDRAMSQRSSPFRSIGALRDYIMLLLSEVPARG